MRHSIFLIIFIVLLCIMPAQSISITRNDNKIYQNYLTYDPSLNSDKIQTILNTIDESLLRSYLEPLVDLAPRYTGTYGCEQAASFIRQQFTSMGLQTRYHEWSDFGNRYHPKYFTSQNVEATLHGQTDDIILFGAHYDTVENVPGANDDGSGVAAVLASAYVLSQYTFNHTLKFVAFSGEEIGLKGSWAYAKEAYQNNDNIIYDFNADMIGHATTKEGGTSFRLSLTEDATNMEDLFSMINSITDLNFDFGTWMINRDGRGGSDYFPFAAYGYEAVAFWEGEHDPNMHTLQDDLSNINFSYLVNTTKLITGALAYLADQQTHTPQIQIISPKKQSVYRDNTFIESTEILKTIVVNDIIIKAETITKSDLTHVEFYYDDLLATTDTNPPFSWHCNIHSLGQHRITVTAYNKLGEKTTDYVDILFINPI